MEMNGEERIAAPRQVVWEALNDPDVLRECIPGCESLEKSSDTEMSAAVKIKIGPVSARFTGDVTLENINAPESYTISGEGKGGIAGFAKGGADVKLVEDGAETVLTYDVKGSGRRQARPARLPPDRLHIEEARRPVFHEVQRGGQRQGRGRLKP
jgi:carbon monoxide dehydrogenase subunit G